MNPNRIKRIEERHTKARQFEVREGLKETLSSKAGRVFVWELLSMAGVFQNAFTNNALTTAHTTGRQALGQELLVMVTSEFPDAYFTMMKENLQREEELKAKLVAIHEENNDEYANDPE